MGSGIVSIKEAISGWRTTPSESNPDGVIPRTTLGRRLNQCTSDQAWKTCDGTWAISVSWLNDQFEPAGVGSSADNSGAGSVSSGLSDGFDELVPHMTTSPPLQFNLDELTSVFAQVLAPLLDVVEAHQREIVAVTEERKDMEHLRFRHDVALIAADRNEERLEEALKRQQAAALNAVAAGVERDQAITVLHTKHQELASITDRFVVESSEHHETRMELGFVLGMLSWRQRRRYRNYVAEQQAPCWTRPVVSGNGQGLS